MSQPAKPAVCLFAHYAPDRRLSASVLHYLTQLTRCGFAVHVALSGMDRLVPEDREILDRLGIAAYPRPNAGLDFGAWQFLFRIGCARDAKTVLLANDSVFGPLLDLLPIMAAMQARNYDVWGMVESHERSWHLQSWFICFNAASLARPAISRVFEQPFEQMSKAEIVLHGEVGLGTAIRAENLSWGACLPDTRRGLRKLVAANPMHVDWLSVLRSERVPFIKVELLRDNPVRVPWLGLWPKIVSRYQSFPEAWIRERITPAGPGSGAGSLRMRLLYVLLTRDRGPALRALFFPPRHR
jgi:lipopolysaccharide biosynthesis protein